MRFALVTSIGLVLCTAGLAFGQLSPVAGEPPPAFSRKPAVTRSAGKARVSFAVTRETDVAVSIEDGQGRVIRHLAAGVLGRNPPPPLKADSLDQAVEWDGKADYGRDAGPGPFRVRVALGLGAKFDKVLLGDPNTLQHIKGLAVGPDGTVYVLEKAGGSVWAGETLLAFNRDGQYERTVAPFPAGLKPEQVKGFGTFELDGRPAPLVHEFMLGLYPPGRSARKGTMAVTPEGVILRLVEAARSPARIAAVGGRGDLPWAAYQGPALAGVCGDRSALAASSDGRWAFVGGLATKSGGPPVPAVYRVALPDRGPGEPFFGDPAGAGSYLDVVVDRFRPDPEIYTRCGVYHDWWFRFNERTGQVDKLQLPDRYVGGIGYGLRPGPDGCLYGLWYPFNLYKFDRNGKRLTWAEPNQPPAGAQWNRRPVKLGPESCYVPNSECALTHTLAVRQDGHIFAFEPGHPGSRPPKALHEYLPSGRRVTADPIIWMVSDAALGPLFDAQGNIYVAEFVTPPDWPYPPQFEKTFGPIKGRLRDTPQAVTANMYGSILKFTPKGGMVRLPKGGLMSGEDRPFAGEPKLDPALKTLELAGYYDGRFHPVPVTGAEWAVPGISHVGLFSCTCENVTFDVDPFGRVWFPDLNLFRVRVIDAAGNAITRFGGYGNADNIGPDSKDPDKSGPGQPEIALAWLVGVGATDKYAYLGDSLNRRMLRCKLVYAAEETCDVR